MNKYIAYIKWHSGITYVNEEYEEYENIINFESENVVKAKEYVLSKNWITPSNGEAITIIHYYIQKCNENLDKLK